MSLSSHYPFPDALTITNGLVLAGLVGIPLASGGLFLSLRRTRALVMGCLFWGVAIFPALGVIGFTDVIAADRFTYFPMVGLLIALAGGLVQIQRRAWTRPRNSVMVAVTFVVLSVVAAEIAAVRGYLVHWTDTASLYARMISRAPNVADLRWTLCNHYLARGLPDAALPECEAAVRLAPQAPQAHTNLGNTLSALGRIDDAKRHFEAALSFDEASAVTHNDLGALLAKDGDWAGAVLHFERAVELNPELASAWRNLGQVCLLLGQADRAVVALQEAVRLEPTHIGARLNLSQALVQVGRTDGALVELQAVLRIDPEHRLAKSLVTALKASTSNP